MANFVWLASYPKSGNTWLRAFIYNLIVTPREPAPLTAITGFFESESNPKYYQRFLQKPLLEASFEELIALRPRVQQAILESGGQGSILLKTHNQLTILHGTPLHNLNRTAAAIYVVRNPLDLVLSVADHFALSTDEAIAFINNPNTGMGADNESVGGFPGSWAQHVESWTRSDHERFLVVRYEDMLERPIPTFTRVAAQLGLKPERSALRRAIELSSFKRLQAVEAKHGFTERSVHSRRFFRKGKKNQWIENLSEDQVISIIEFNRQQMAKFDYIPQKFSKPPIRS